MLGTYKWLVVLGCHFNNERLKSNLWYSQYSGLNCLKSGHDLAFAHEKFVLWMVPGTLLFLEAITIWQLGKWWFCRTSLARAGFLCLCLEVYLDSDSMFVLYRALVDWSHEKYRAKVFNNCRSYNEWLYINCFTYSLFETPFNMGNRLVHKGIFLILSWYTCNLWTTHSWTCIRSVLWGDAWTFLEGSASNMLIFYLSMYLALVDC